MRQLETVTDEARPRVAEERFERSLARRGERIDRLEERGRGGLDLAALAMRDVQRERGGCGNVERVDTAREGVKALEILPMLLGLHESARALKLTARTLSQKTSTSALISDERKRPNCCISARTGRGRTHLPQTTRLLEHAPQSVFAEP